MKISEAKQITGGLSATKKMPCKGYSLPAAECKIGAYLRKIKGSTCNKCYAFRGNYAWPNVQKKLYHRLDSLNNPQWVEAMVTLIKKQEKSGFFRWHDSGDLQNVEHLEKIVEVCLATPNVQHWLPTREYSIVRLYLENKRFPANLTVRLSAHYVDKHPSTTYNLPTSTVHTKGSVVVGVECPAYLQNNQCGECRNCWNPTVLNVSYLKH